MLQTSERTVCPTLDPVGEHTIPTNQTPVLSRRWLQRKRVIVLPLILLIIILGAALFGPLHWIAGSQAQSQSSEALTAGISALGVLEAPTYDLDFSSTVTGVISDINVTLGQHVVTNQVLALLGQNTYVAQVQQARVAVDAGRNVLKAAQQYVSIEIQHAHSLVVLAVTTYQAELNNRQALQRQANANIDFARVTLEADQATLRAVKKAAQASIEAAKATLTTALASCSPGTTTPSTGSSTSTGSTTPSTTSSTSTGSTTSSTTSSTSTGSTTPSTSSSTTTGSTTPSSSSSTSTGSTTPSSSSSASTSCVQAAEATYQAAVTAANVTVVTAQGTVQKDQAALTQAKANANVSLVAENGLIQEASANINVAQTNPDVANAYLDLASAENTYRIALAALLVAQQTLELTILRAPHPGVVSAIIGTIGSQPGAVNNLVPAGGVEIQSDHGGLTFIQIVDTDNIHEILAYVDENDIQKIHVGQAARFTLRANANQQFSGSIIAIAPNGLGFPTAATTQADSRFPVIIDIGNQSNTHPKLYSGMTGTVSITP